MSETRLGCAHEKPVRALICGGCLKALRGMAAGYAQALRERDRAEAEVGRLRSALEEAQRKVFIARDGCNGGYHDMEDACGVCRLLDETLVLLGSSVEEMETLFTAEIAARAGPQEDTEEAKSD